MKTKKLLAIAIALAILPAGAADDRFHKTKPGSMNGFLAATDPVYVKECGACHFAYSPGLLPARSWELHMQRLDKHFGESIRLDPAAHEAVSRYLTENAADRSNYEGSRTFMERMPKDTTPFRLLDVPLYREMHAIIRQVIHLKPQIRARTLTNCVDCHQYAPEGSFGNDELIVPGLTRNVTR